jgi:general stress protein YciG
MAEKSKRGFAIMDLDKRRHIASKGGKAAHAKGTAHEFTPEEAREAGRKGGQAAHQRGTAHQFTPEEAREAGRKGGKAALHRNKSEQAFPPAPPNGAAAEGELRPQAAPPMPQQNLPEPNTLPASPFEMRPNPEENPESRGIP